MFNEDRGVKSDDIVIIIFRGPELKALFSQSLEL